MNAEEQMVVYALKVLAAGAVAEACPYGEQELLTLAGRIESGKIHVAPEPW